MAATGDNTSDSVRDLIRRDQERADKFAELQRFITEGLESGISERSIAEVLEAARQRARNAGGHCLQRDDAGEPERHRHLRPRPG